MKTPPFPVTSSLVALNILSTVGLNRILRKHNSVTKIGYRCLATGNSFASFYFEYLLGETAFRKISRDLRNVIWNCLQATEISERQKKFGWKKLIIFMEERNYRTACALWKGRIFVLKCHLDTNLCFITTALLYFVFGFSRWRVLLYRSSYCSNWYVWRIRQFSKISYIEIKIVVECQRACHWLLTTFRNARHSWSWWRGFRHVTIYVTALPNGTERRICNCTLTAACGMADCYTGMCCELDGSCEVNWSVWRQTVQRWVGVNCQKGK